MLPLGRFYGPIDTPQLVGEKELKKKKIQKLLSGENHAMILADKKVYVWGDPETGVCSHTYLFFVFIY